MQSNSLQLLFQIISTQFLVYQLINDIYFNMFSSYPFFHHDFPSIITGWLFFRGLTPWGVAAAAGKAAAKAAEVEGAIMEFPGEQ